MMLLTSLVVVAAGIVLGAVLTVVVGIGFILFT